VHVCVAQFYWHCFNIDLNDPCHFAHASSQSIRSVDFSSGRFTRSQFSFTPSASWKLKFAHRHVSC
jgi:hypothetical protein